MIEFGNYKITWNNCINSYGVTLRNLYIDRKDTMIHITRSKCLNRKIAYMYTSQLKQKAVGTFKILEKLSDVLYRVNCGRSGTTLVIHTDRLRKVKPKLLRGEDLDYSTMTDDKATAEHDDVADIELDTESSEQNSDQEEAIIYTRACRQKKIPAWHKDYVLSIFRLTTMVKTKNTSRKHIICPICKEDIPPSQSFEDYVVICAKNRLVCEHCQETFKRKEYLKRHIKLKHANIDLQVSKPKECQEDGLEKIREEQNILDEFKKVDEVNVSVDDSSDWDSYPEIQLEGDDVREDETLILGRMVSKGNNPQPVQSGRRSKVSQEVEGCGMETKADMRIDEEDKELDGQKENNEKQNENDNKQS